MKSKKDTLHKIVEKVYYMDSMDDLNKQHLTLYSYTVLCDAIETLLKGKPYYTFITDVAEWLRKNGAAVEWEDANHINYKIMV